MASSLGFEQALWLKETTTAYANVETMTSAGIILPVRGDLNFGKVIGQINTEHLRQSSYVQEEENDHGLVSVEGDFGGTVPASSIGFKTLIKHLTGKLVVAGTAPYVGTYTWNDDIFLGLSFAQHKAGSLYAWHGCQIEKFSLSFKVGGPLEYRCTVVGASEDAVAAETTVPTLTLLAATPYYLTEHITFSLDTVAEAITEMTIDFNCELLKSEEQSYAAGSNTRVSLARGGVKITGTIKRRHDKDDSNQSKFYTKFLSGAPAALLVDCDHPTDADHNMEINLGVVKFDDARPLADGQGHTFETIPFTAYDLDAATSDIVISDDNATPATATGTYDGTGT
uniref:Tail protein n=1 Tax=viral metagenome TaxID=1070528 RepID=A0A6M3JC92_9ZZZZ